MLAKARWFLSAKKSICVRPLTVISLLLILSLACSLPGFWGSTPAPAATPTPETPPQTPLPPALVESDPIPNGTLMAHNEVILYFNQAMNQASLESSLQWQPPLQGTFTWLDLATVRFTPTQPLPPATRMTLTLPASLQAENGLQLGQALELTFNTPAELQVVESLPKANATEVDPNAAVAVSFNQPVAPLGAAQSHFTPAFTLEPQAKGRGEWLNTSTYVFYPNPPLQGGARYALTLNPELTSQAGAALASTEKQVRRWFFTTAPPRLQSLEPDPKEALAVDSSLTLTFNQPMETASVEQNLTLTDGDGNPVKSRYRWENDDSVLVLQPDDLLERRRTYTLTLSAQARARGGTLLANEVRAQYTTISPLAILTTTPPPGQPLNVYDGYGSFIVEFNAPLAKQDLSALIHIEPEITNLSFYLDNDQRTTVYVSGFFQPATQYTLTFSPQLSDRWGKTTGKPIMLHFYTSLAAPQLSVPMLQMGTSALFVLPYQAQLQAQATNLSQLRITSSRLSLDEFIQTAENPANNSTSIPGQSQQTWLQRLSLTPNRSQSIQIPLSANGSSLPTGLYYFQIQSPELTGDQSHSPSPFLAVVSPIQLYLKRSSRQVWLWAVDLRSNQPQSNATIALYHRNATNLGTCTTNAQGVCAVDLPILEDEYTSVYAITGQPGDEGFSLAIDNWSAGVAGWDFGISTQTTQTQPFIYLYTDRPIYQAGQTVNFRAIIRQKDNGRYSLPFVNRVSFDVLGEYSVETSQRPLITTLTLPLSSYGTATGSFTLPEGAQPGLYTLQVKDNIYAQINFRVAEYHKPEIDLQVHFDQSEWLAGEDLQAAITANYFFGAPASNTHFHWVLYTTPDDFYLPSGYVTGKHEQDWPSEAWRLYPFGFGVQVSEGDGQTDPAGRYTLHVSSDDLQQVIDMQARQRLTLEVTLQEQDQAPVSARDNAIQHPEQFYIGVRQESWVGQADAEQGYIIQTVDPQGNPSGNHPLRATFQKVEWKIVSNLQWGFDMPNPKAVYTPISSADFQTDADGRARLTFTPPDPGSYQLEVSSQNAVTQVFTWVGGAGAAAWPALPNQQLPLVANADVYQPGENAHLLIQNPFAGQALAWVTVERSRVLRSQVIKISGSSYELVLPLSPEDAPNVYVSVTLLGQSADGAPDFRQGYVPLQVTPIAQTLNVDLMAQPERSQPGGQVNFSLRVTDSQGQPVQGEFSLAVVDKALLALTDPNSLGILEAFYGQQPLGVTNGLSLAAFAGRIHLVPPVGGAGGGDAGLPFSLREKFADTAYWNGTIETDASGMAQVSLTLPDNPTTWVADLRGITLTSQVGEADTEIVASKDLLIRPVSPRFLVAGDHVQLAATVHNNTAQELDANVRLEAQGLTFDNPNQALQAVTIPANGQQRVTWWVSAQDVDQAELVFSVQAGILQDATRPEGGILPVLRYSTPQTYATTGILSEGGERLESISLPRSFKPSGGELRVEMSPSLAAAVLSGLEALEKSPTDFNEPLLSRLLPNVVTYRSLQELGLQSPTLKSRLEKVILDCLERLLSAQNPDGGWGWASGQPSDSYISAYVLFGLSQAYQAGVFIDPAALQKAQQYLSGAWAASIITASQPWQLDRLVFQQFVLQQSGQENLNVNRLYEQRSQLNPWSKALLAVIIGTQSSPADERVRELLNKLESSALRSASGVHWEEQFPSSSNFGSPNFTTAMVIHALARLDPASTLLSDAVRYLVAHRRSDGAWNSSYETAWVLLALTEVLKGTGELQASYAYSASLNNNLLIEGQAGGVNNLTPIQATVGLDKLLTSGPNALTITREEGRGRLYYRASLQVYRPVDDLAPLERGLSLSRSYYLAGQDCRQQSCPPITAVQLAETAPVILVRLSLTLPEAMQYLVVEDTIPAGMEILDIQLKTSPQGAAVYTLPYDPRDPFSAGWGWWYFNDPQIYSDHIRWVGRELPAGSYELTYRLLPLQAGSYRLIPAHAYEYYFPEVEGSSGGGVFEIKPQAR